MFDHELSKSLDLHEGEIKLPVQFAFVHLPRVGGTSIRLKLLEKYGNNGLHWSATQGLEPFNSANPIFRLRAQPFAYELKRLLMNFGIGSINGNIIYRAIRNRILGSKSNKHKEDTALVERNFKFVIGHFDAVTIRSLFPGIPLVSMVRDPFDRLVSEFIYQGRTQEADFDLFMKSPSRINYLSRVLGLDAGISLNDYVCIGITSKIDDFFRKIGLTDSKELKTAKHNQMTANSELRAQLNKFRPQFELLNARDVELYKTISSRW